MSRCRFSHKISQEHRDNEDYMTRLRNEKDEKASKCINEFRKVGSCDNRNNCPFSHKITDADRNDSAMKARMKEKIDVLKKRREVEGVKKEEKVVNSHGVLKEVMALRKELKEELSGLQELKEMMKAKNGP